MRFRTFSVSTFGLVLLCALACGGESRPPASPGGSNDPNAPTANGNPSGAGIGSPDTGANPATPVGTAISSPQSPGGIGASPSGIYGGRESSSGVTPGGAVAPSQAKVGGGSGGAAGTGGTGGMGGTGGTGGMGGMRSR
jgi:hypothetical protein